MNNSKMFAIYLRDHQAAAAAGVQLIQRIAANNADSEFGPPLREVARQIEEDKETLERLLGALGIKPSALKQAITRLGERFARGKLNGRVVRYSPLSRVLELEGMTAAVRGKMRLWASLALIRPYDTRLTAFEFEKLQERALGQSRVLENLHRRAVQVAFVGHESQVNRLEGAGAAKKPALPPGARLGSRG